MEREKVGKVFSPVIYSDTCWLQGWFNSNRGTTLPIQRKTPFELVRLCFKKDVCGGVDIISGVHEGLSCCVSVKTH